MIKFSSSLKFNKIHKVDSSFNEDPKNINFLGEGWLDNLGKITGTSIVMQIGGAVNFEREYQPCLLVPKLSLRAFEPDSCFKNSM